jgi:hypothetical protein
VVRRLKKKSTPVNKKTHTTLAKKQKNMTNLATLSLNAIRVDAVSGLASAIDWVKSLTGYSPSEASAALRRLLCQEGDELRERVVHVRINGQGRATPATDAQTMVEIGMLLTGHGADALRKLASDVLVRALGGDADLVTRVNARRATLTSLEKTFFNTRPRAVLNDTEEDGYDTLSESVSDGEEEDESSGDEEEEEEEDGSDDDDDEESSDAALPADWGVKDETGAINIPPLSNKQTLTLLGFDRAARKRFMKPHAGSDDKEARAVKKARRGSFVL